jgi:hypothetical protein
MNRRVLALSLPVLAAVAMGARPPTHPKHEYHYKAASIAGADGLDVKLEGAESQQEFLKLKVKLTNTTSDKVFVIAKEKGEFTLPSGKVPARAPALFDGPLVLMPGDSKAHVWEPDMKSGLHPETFSFVSTGAITAAATGTPVTAPDFQLKPSRNDFTAGPFSCNLNEIQQDTDKSFAVFTCTYNGTGVGYIDARKVIGVSKSGTQYANMQKNMKRDVVLPGGKAKFSTRIEIPSSDADMQFVPYNLVFGETFSEAASTPVTLPIWSFEVDQALTTERN